MAYTIYAMRDPRTDTVRYVGATGLPLEARLAFHMAGVHSESRRSPGERWLRDLASAGLKPLIEPLETVNTEDMGAVGNLEQSWIEHFEDQDCHLLNVRKGGGGLCSGRDSGPSAWAMFRFSLVPDRIIAEHEGKNVQTIFRWRQQFGASSYPSREKLVSSLSPVMREVVVTWNEILKAKRALEITGELRQRHIDKWINAIEGYLESIELQGEERDFAIGHCRLLIGILREDGWNVSFLEEKRQMLEEREALALS